MTILYRKQVYLGNTEPSSVGTPGAYVDTSVAWHGDTQPT